MIRLPISKLADDIRDSDVLVVGAGVAGMAAALALAPRRVALLCKSPVGAGGSSPWAQGGVAGALGRNDSPRLHAADTEVAGAGLCDPAVVRLLTEEGPERLRQLMTDGAKFDTITGQLSLGREGAHSRRRILHAGGDATGAEMVRALAVQLREQPHVDVFEDAEVTDLVHHHRRLVGVLARHRRDGRTFSVFHRAPSVVLATGGFGQVYSRTTNPRGNTGDGLALAARAGARLADLEFVQFHPTALHAAADPLPLCTEALRGEGAVLLDGCGERFMPEIHELAELAPRDIVARAIWRQQKETGRVLLDARSAVGEAFPRRFPTVWQHCRHFGIDPRREAIPVTPAAHYTMAGVATDGLGRTSLDGLWACGEVAASGVHGANRLASNSLLEALVFGHRVAKDITSREPHVARDGVVSREEACFDPARRAELRRLMWDKVGLVRSRQGLGESLERLDGWADVEARRGAEPSTEQNLWTVARLVTAAALVREESRGSHFREDFPNTEIAWRRRLAWTYRTVPGELPLQKSVGDELLQEIA